MKYLKLLCLITSYLIPCTMYTQDIHLDVEGNVKIVGKIDIVVDEMDSTSLAIGRDAGDNLNHDSLLYNTLVGVGSGHHITSGLYNSIFGSYAGFNNTTGNSNSFFGRSAGFNNTTGEFNSFFGTIAGFSNTTGNSNSFFGRSAGLLNTVGAYNSFFGTCAGSSNTTGADNSFFGTSAGESNTTGQYNSFFGRSAGLNNTTGNANSFFGTRAGESNTTGEFNSFFGRSAGSDNITGFSNSFFGQSSGGSNTTGDSNSFFGRNAGRDNTEGDSNSFFGTRAGKSNTTGNANSFFGQSSGGSNTTGDSNSFFGSGAGFSNTTGNANSFFGPGAGSNNNTGSSNSFFGLDAGLNNTTGTNNTFLGSDSGVSSSDSLDRAIAIGFQAKVNCSHCAVIGGTGVNAVHVGIGTSNPINELEIAGTSSNGVAGFTRSDIAGSDKSHILFGPDGDWYIRPSKNTGKIVIADKGGNVGIGTASPSEILDVVGNIRVRTVGAGALDNDIGITTDGVLTTASSDRRLKKEIETYDNALGKLMSIRGVSFKWKDDDAGRKRLGVIAQEVEEHIPEVVFENDGYLGVNYSQLSAVFIEAIKEQQKQIENLQLEVSRLNKIIEGGSN